jgi:hypothetical protein
MGIEGRSPRESDAVGKPMRGAVELRTAFTDPG